MTPPTIYSTQQWGARRVLTMFPQSPAVGIVIHNTQGANRDPLPIDAEARAAFALARSLQADHMDDRHWSDTGQHFTISRGGVICEGRTGSLAAAQAGQVVKRAHAGVDWYNRTWFGIELEGDNRAEYALTDLQWNSMVELCAWLAYWGQFDTMHIEGHCTVKGTANGGTDCPGHVMDRMTDLRSAAHGRKVQILAAR